MQKVGTKIWKNKIYSFTESSFADIQKKEAKSITIKEKKKNNELNGNNSKNLQTQIQKSVINPWMLKAVTKDIETLIHNLRRIQPHLPTSVNTFTQKGITKINEKVAGPPTVDYTNVSEEMIIENESNLTNYSLENLENPKVVTKNDKVFSLSPESFQGGFQPLVFWSNNAGNIT